ncbi:MAG: hypothetical protein EB084_03535 [Proteobacteria bacterium]|nr:hypothetical protein [Pseudomonadota bacterium]
MRHGLHLARHHVRVLRRQAVRLLQPLRPQPADPHPRRAPRRHRRAHPPAVHSRGAARPQPRVSLHSPVAQPVGGAARTPGGGVGGESCGRGPCDPHRLPLGPLTHPHMALRLTCRVHKRRPDIG